MRWCVCFITMHRSYNRLSCKFTAIFRALCHRPGWSAKIGFRSREKIAISVLPLDEYIGQQIWITAEDTTITKDDKAAIVIYRNLQSAAACASAEIAIDLHSWGKIAISVLALGTRPHSPANMDCDRQYDKILAKQK